MQTIKIMLGGAEYEIAQLPIRQAREWRQKFSEPLEQVIGAVQGGAEAIQRAFDGNSSVNAGDLVGALGQTLLGSVGRALLGSMDLVLDMVYSYAPNLLAHKDAIEESAYDDEIMLAFVEVLKLAYPFGQILAIVRPGQTAKQTRKN